MGALRTRAAQGVLREEGDARGAGRDGPRGLAGALVEDQLVTPERLASHPAVLCIEFSSTVIFIIDTLSSVYMGV